MQFGCLTWDFIFSSHVIWPQAWSDYYHESHAIYGELQQYNELREKIADFRYKTKYTKKNTEADFFQILAGCQGLRLLFM